jgi:hypothetical protein
MVPKEGIQLVEAMEPSRSHLNKIPLVVLDLRGGTHPHNPHIWITINRSDPEEPKGFPGVIDHYPRVFILTHTERKNHLRR